MQALRRARFFLLTAMVGLAAWFFLLLPSQAAARQITVCPNGTHCDYSIITAAVNGAKPGDVVLVQPGVYCQELTGAINHPLTLAAGAGAVVEVHGTTGPKVAWLTVAAAVEMEGSFEIHNAMIDMAPNGRLLQKGNVTIDVQWARIGVSFGTNGTWIQDGNLTIISTDESNGINLGAGSKWIQNGDMDIHSSVMSNGFVATWSGTWTQNGDVRASVTTLSTGVLVAGHGIWEQNGKVTMNVSSAGKGIYLRDGAMMWTQNGDLSINMLSSNGVVFANKGGMWYQNGQVGLFGVSGSNGVQFTGPGGNWMQNSNATLWASTKSSAVVFSGGGTWTQNATVSITTSVEATGVQFTGQGGNWAQREDMTIIVEEGFGVYADGHGVQWTQDGNLNVQIAGGQGILFDKSEGGTWTQVGNVTISATGSNTGMSVATSVNWVPSGGVDLFCRDQGAGCMCQVPAARTSLANAPLVTDCFICPRGQYRLAAVTCSRSAPRMGCHDCPYTADCSRGGASIYSLVGYWCGRTANDPSRLECVECPDGYCRPDAVAPWDQACQLGRRGTLCGQCAAGNSEAFGTMACVRDADCSAWRWLIPAVLLIGLCYILLIVWLPINHHPLWKSMTYFMQTLPLIASLDNAMLRTTTAVFTLDPSVLGIHVTACPWSGFTATEKMAADYVLPAVLVVELGLVLALHRLIRWPVAWVGRLRASDPSRVESLEKFRLTTVDEGEGEEEGEEDANDNDNDDDEDDADHKREEPASNVSRSRRLDYSHGTEYARYAGALTALVLLMYEGVTSATMDLLNCVPWDGALRLFRAGYVTCYAEWQYPLFVLLGGLIVPFPLLLVGFRRWLSSRQRRRGGGAWGWAVLRVLEGPYARGRTWWESVGMLRRLALLAVATFVPDPMWRALGLAAGSFVVLLSHAYLRPYADRYYGWAEMLFLCDLMLVAVLQIPQATFATLGRPFEGAPAEVVAYLQEALALLPLLFCAYVLVRRYGPPLGNWLLCKMRICFRGGESARKDDTGDRERRNKRHHCHTADDEERLLSDGAEVGAEDEDEASMHLDDDNKEPNDEDSTVSWRN